MKLIELVLVGYRRLLLNNIKTLTYTPTCIYQLVLGTNGSGKSSILFEATPLPANTADYTKNGRKLTRWEHNGSLYELESTFKSGSKHSFNKDGVEMNPGHTGAVQKELVKQEFGITSDIHEVLIDQERFTEMSPNKRREWLTLLCDTDFTFALGLYSKLKSAHRDAQGAFKHLSGRLTQETSQLKRLDDNTGWAAEAKQLQEELEMLFTNKSNRNLVGGETKIKNLQDYECRIAEKMLGIKNPLPSAGQFTSHEDLQAAIKACEGEVDLLSHSLTWTSEALDDLIKLQTTVESSGVSDVESALVERTALNAKQALLASQLNQYQYTPDCHAHAALLSIESITEDLNHVLKSIPDNSERRFTKTDVDTTKAKLRETKERFGIFQNKVAKDEAFLEHVSGLCKINCPNCKHEWLPGDTEERGHMAQKSLAANQRTCEELKSSITEMEGYLEEANEFSGYFVKFRGLVSNNPSLKPFWDRLLDADGINRNPEHWVFEFSLFVQDVSGWFEISKLEEQSTRISLAIDAMNNVSGVGKLAEHIAEHQRKISSITHELVVLKAKQTKLKTANVKVIDLYRLNEELEKTQVKKDEAFDDYLIELRDQSIGEITRQHQNRLAFLNAKLSEKKTLEDLVEDLVENRNAVEKEMAAYKLLVEELSPVDGLIADQLTGFLKSFTDHMNTLVSNVWTYDMPVLPCGLASGELDYKFPFRVKSEDQPIPDVGKGSRGQKEIFDFAFKLIVMFYLRLTDYPLYLDELGHSFDEQHRINVMNFIKDLVETKGFSQVFMISHYASSHGAFTQAEVLVMDATNVAVPIKHNQHVVMT